MIDVKRLRKEVEETEGLLEIYNDESYKDWLDNHAERHIRLWLIKNDYNTDTCMTIEYITYIANHFVEWKSENE